MRALLLTLSLSLAAVSITPVADAGCSWVWAPYPVAMGACPDPQGTSCVKLREGIETCASAAGSYYVSDDPPAEYHCEDVYPQPDCCPLTYPNSCAGEIKLACVDHVNGPFWNVSSAGTSVSVWVSHWCYYTGCPELYAYCGFFDRLMYRIPLQTIDV